MQLLEGFGSVVVLGDPMEQLAVELKERAEESVEQCHGASAVSVEDRRDVGLRAAYDPQDLRRRGLLLKGFGNVSMSLCEGEIVFLQFGEEAHVLEGDDRLVREGLHELKLLVGEGLNRSPPHRNYADERPFATHRHTEKRPDAANARGVDVSGTPVRVGLRIEDLDGPVLQSHATNDCAIPGPNVVTLRPFAKRRRGIVIHREVVQVTLRAKDEPLLRAAKAGRILNERLQYGLEIKG